MPLTSSASFPPCILKRHTHSYTEADLPSHCSQTQSLRSTPLKSQSSSRWGANASPTLQVLASHRWMGKWRPMKRTMSQGQPRLSYAWRSKVLTPAILGSTLMGSHLATSSMPTEERTPSTNLPTLACSPVGTNANLRPLRSTSAPPQPPPRAPASILPLPSRALGVAIGVWALSAVWHPSPPFLYNYC